MSEFEKLRKNWMTFDEFRVKYEKVQVEEYPNKVLDRIPNPVVSVHVITYEHANFIDQAVRSVLMQKTNFSFEIIIGDDDSRDGTRELCIEYAKMHPDKIRLFLHKNENNIAIDGDRSHVFQYAYNSFQLRGEYVAVCSGDDYWTDPLKLQKQVDFMNKNQRYSYCYHSWKEIKESQPAKLFKTDWTGTVLNKNFYDHLPEQILQSYNEDEFVKQISLLIGRGMYLENIKPSVHRIHGSNMWASKDDKFLLQQYENMSLSLLQVFSGTARENVFIRQYLERSTTHILYKLSKNFSLDEIGNWFLILLKHKILLKTVVYLPVILTPKIYRIIAKKC